MRTYSNKYSVFIKPVIFFGVTVTFLIIVISMVYKTTQSLFAKIETAKSERFLLEERVSVLRDAEPDLGTDIAQTAVGVLPSENPSLLVISQVRKLASENVVTLDNVTLNARDFEGEEYPSVEINFKAKGTYEGISTLVSALSTYAPLMNLTQSKMSDTKGEVEAEISIKSFWSPYPKELPSISEQISGLTAEERDLMDKLSTFKRAEVLEVGSLEPQESEERPDPFTLEI